MTLECLESHGTVPVGTTFLITYEVRPSESNFQRDQVGGAFVNCWIVTDSLESALRITIADLLECGWTIVERTEAKAASAADFEDSPYYKQVQVDGLVTVFHTFPWDDLELN